jgi:hypothetical protein
MGCRVVNCRFYRDFFKKIKQSGECIEWLKSLLNNNRNLSMIKKAQKLLKYFEEN